MKPFSLLVNRNRHERRVAAPGGLSGTCRVGDGNPQNGTDAGLSSNDREAHRRDTPAPECHCRPLPQATACVSSGLKVGRSESTVRCRPARRHPGTLLLGRRPLGNRLPYSRGPHSRETWPVTPPLQESHDIALDSRGTPWRAGIGTRFTTRCRPITKPSPPTGPKDRRRSPGTTRRHATHAA